ncbi:hypothetical protein V2J09_014752 [Rumex salicifolius]
MAGKSKVLVVGGTGYIGKRIVEASLKQGHETFVLRRPEIGFDIDKVQTLLGLKKMGAQLVEGSFSDHRSLVEAVKKADVVICTMSGVHFRSHDILLQLKLVEAIKEAGNVKRFLPSEFGIDSARMGNALEAARITFDEKMQVRKAIDDASIPFTYVSASVFVDEDDVATYTVKTIDDPRTLNKTLYIRPQENILSQRELIGIWEKLLGKELNKKSISGPEFLSKIKGADLATQGIICRLYHIFFDGCLSNFEVGEDEEASKLYPEVKYKRMDDYLKLYIPN